MNNFNTKKKLDQFQEHQLEQDQLAEVKGAWQMSIPLFYNPFTRQQASLVIMSKPENPFALESCIAISDGDSLI